MTTETYPLVSNDQDRQAFYERLRDKGESHPIAEICALQQSPKPKGGDRAFWEGHLGNHGFDEKDPSMPEILAEAKRAGIPTAGKIYVGGLADGRGGADPLAWVSDTSDVKYVAKKRRKAVKGVINFRGDTREEEPEKGPRLAEDLVQEAMRREAALDPAWLEDLEGLREYVIDRYGRKE